MQIVNLTPLDNGALDNRIVDDAVDPIDGWAYLKDPESSYENFPFGQIKTVVGNWPNGKQGAVVVSWDPITIPEPQPVPVPPDDQPSEFDKLQAQVLYTAVQTDTLLLEGGPDV